MQEPEKVTPIRQQYLRVKQNYPGAIVLFRLGDFYETFDDDARIVAKELSIVLTSRQMGKDNRVPMAGIPYHALDSYMGKLIKRGYKLAICEQLSPPSGKGLVPRDVVRVVTPGTVVETGLLDGKSNNFLAAIVIEGPKAGISHIDITTGEFFTAVINAEQVTTELARITPAELLVPEGFVIEKTDFAGTITAVEKQDFELDDAARTLQEHFGVASLEGYGCDRLPLAIKASGGILAYLEKTQKAVLSQISNLTTYATGSFMVMDAQTRRNLNLFSGGAVDGEGPSLLSVIDFTRTPMGSRMLKKWVGQPLMDTGELEKRQDVVGWLVEKSSVRLKIIALLGKIADMERIVNRVQINVVIPRELLTLKSCLLVAEEIKELEERDSFGELFPWLVGGLKSCNEIINLIGASINEGPVEGAKIKPGFSAELDKLHFSSKDARQYLANLEKVERERTGIKSLKVGYNKIFGYYIEVSNSNLDQVPSHYIRKQTLSGNERFFTPELKEQESIILNAQERIDEVENVVYRNICSQIAGDYERILSTARTLAQMDVLAALAEAAARFNYTRPVLNDGETIVIKEGRHPIVERVLEGESFIPNDTYLDCNESQLVILTGPNMAGKSTYIRQVGLIVIMAQIGSFVPADSAIIGLTDRIFTRVGLRDDLAAGQSTFMVEMVETANILNNGTRRSLIILDEIGRGTSTYDGISIARAVAEYIHNHKRLGSRTLFATHYHEMVDLAAVLPRVRNFNIAVREEDGRVLFLRKIVPGGADKSYGIHVAQLAGLPRAVTNRARELLLELESMRSTGNGKSEKASGRTTAKHHIELENQLPLFGQDGEISSELSTIDISSMTPLEAITKLYELQKKARQR
ncbi:MAG: DNA mismatch repair protein MutS [Dehalococcoidia bacterium]|nr:DNA mismatch repair protein MutS [Dehalococcoidia bacterium]